MNGRRCLVHIKQEYILIISNSESELCDVKALTLDAEVMQLYKHLSVLFLLFPGVGNSKGFPDIIISHELLSRPVYYCVHCYNWA